MKKLIYSLFVVLFNALTIGCNSDQPTVEINNPELLSRSKSLALEYSSTLKNNLKAAIVSDGVEGAIEFCSLHAVPITDSISKINTVEFKRVSHKNRNPHNKANATELQLIDDYITNYSKAPRLFKKGSENFFYAPIYMDSPLCLNCHGNVDQHITSPVQEKLNTLYPNDQATGFKHGEIRGLLKIIYSKN